MLTVVVVGHSLEIPSFLQPRPPPEEISRKMTVPIRTGSHFPCYADPEDSFLLQDAFTANAKVPVVTTYTPPGYEDTWSQTD